MSVLAPTPEELAELELAHQDAAWEADLHRQYMELTRDKRAGIGIVPCPEWRADKPNGAFYCHCHKVPGNLHNNVPPHDASNYQGRPWCAAHQSTDCDEPHPFVTWQQFRRRFKKPGE